MWDEVDIQRKVEAGGGLYRGLAMRNDPKLTLVLFDDPTEPVNKRSTLALKPRDLTPGAVREALDAKQHRFNTAKV